MVRVSGCFDAAVALSDEVDEGTEDVTAAADGEEDETASATCSSVIGATGAGVAVALAVEIESAAAACGCVAALSGLPSAAGDDDIAGEMRQNVRVGYWLKCFNPGLGRKATFIERRRIHISQFAGRLCGSVRVTVTVSVLLVTAIANAIDSDTDSDRAQVR